MKFFEILKKIFKKQNPKLLEAASNQKEQTRQEMYDQYGFKGMLNRLVYEVAQKNINDIPVHFPEEDDKNLMKLFIFYVISTMINQDYAANINSIKEFEQIEFLENDNNYKCGIHNKKILTNIRNSLVHKSGNIDRDNQGNIIISNCTKYGQTVKKFSVKIKESILTEIFKKSTSNYRNSNNRIIKELFSMIDNLDESNIINSKNGSYVLLLNLLFSFNKESMFDKYMNFSNSALDLSFLTVNNTGFERTDELVNYYEQNEFVPTTIEEELKYLEERITLAKKGIFLDGSPNNKKCIWNSKKFAFDVENKIHIPNEIVVTHIRDSLSHGYIDIDDYNNFVFYDKSKPTAPKYFELKINEEKIREIINTDYFKEGINIPEFFHKSEWNSHFYRTELVRMHNSFSDFVTFYINKFPNLSVEQVIKYMYDNNKFSTYFFEHPNSICEYWTYSIPKTSKLLVDYIAELANKNSNEDILHGNPDELYDSKIVSIDSFYNGFMVNGDLSYYKALLMYYKNRYSTESIKQIEAECSEKEIKEFANDNYTLSLFVHSMNDEVEWVVIGNTLKNKSEFDRIATAITCHDKYLFEQFIENKQEYNNSLVRIEEIYNHGNEYKMSEELCQYIKKHQLEHFISKMKLKIGLLGLDLINEIASNKNAINYLSHFCNYLKKGNLLDRINYMYILARYNNTRKDRMENDEICNR